jgi:tetratricopeptide (TPR) repeat protein
MLARVHRELGETNLERAVLEELARRRSDATEAYLRLMELAAASEEWDAVLAAAEQMLAVNPLQPAPHRYVADAAEANGNHTQAAASLEVLERLGPRDPADVHYRLASHLRALGRLSEARRHILQSLEEAPRYRAAHRLLLEILKESEPNPAGADAGGPGNPAQERS